jgi:hypothetical protein
MLPGHVFVSEDADVSIGSQADLAGYVEDYGSSDNYNPPAPSSEVQKYSEIVAEEAEGGDLNVNKVPAAYGGTPGIFNYWVNPADPTGDIQAWRTKIAGEGDVKPDYDLSLLLPWNWGREVYNQLLAEEKAKEGGSLPLASSGAIGAGMEQAEKMRRGAITILDSVADPESSENPLNWLGTKTGLIVTGVAGLVLLIMIIK